MVAAAQRARADGVRSMVGFSYRRVPAVALARRLVEQGRIGRLHHVRAHYLQDWILDPQAPLSWRLDKDKAGSGSLGDIGAHLIDMAHYLSGEQIVELGGAMETFVKERPVAAEHMGLSGTATTSDERGPVTVDDAAAFMARLSGGAVGVFEATRFASGHKNGLRIELNGSKGSVIFDLSDMNYLLYHDATEGSDTAGFHHIPGVGARPPVRRGVVAARALARLRAHVHPRGRRPRHRDRRGHRPAPLVRGRPVRPARAGHRRAQRGDPHLAPRPRRVHEGVTMSRPITLFTGQWADLPFEEVARLASEWGYDGLEIACWGDHLDPWRGAEDDAYIQGKLDLLEKYNLKVYAISNHLKGQAVCDDPIDERHKGMLSSKVWGDGDPEGVRAARRRGDEADGRHREAAGRQDA